MGRLILIIVFCFSTPLASFWHNFLPDTIFVQQPAKPSHKATIMLAPYGNNNMQGRSLKSNFESSISHQFVHELAHELESNFPEIRMRISHETTDILSPLQLASMSNCLPTDFFVQFQFYHAQEPTISLYHCSGGNDFASKRWDLSWCHVDQAYLINKKNSTSWAKKLKAELSSSDNPKWFTVNGPYAIPLKPMMGIIAPALLIEIGLANDDDWKQLIAPIAASLKPIIDEIINTSETGN